MKTVKNIIDARYETRDTRVGAERCRSENEVLGAGYEIRDTR